MVAPSGPVYQAGTLSGNPLAMTAGYETLAVLLEEKDFYQRLEAKSLRLAEGIHRNMESLGLPLTQNRVGSMSTLFFTPARVTNYATALRADTHRFAVYFRSMLEHGIYLAPSQFEAGFLSSAHSEDDIDKTIDANKEALRTAFE